MTRNRRWLPTLLVACAALLTATGVTAFPTPQATTDPYTTELGATIKEWNANLASGAEVQTALADRLEAIAKAHPQGWEGAIWASHAITQIPPRGETSAADHMDGAQQWLDEAIRRAGEAPPIVRSEFHMMQTLIHSNRGAGVDDEAERSRLFAASRAAQALAEEANPDNPRAWMFRGFNLIRADRSDEGRIMLSKALGKWDAYPPENPLHPNWGRQWVDFWMGGIEKRERQELPTAGSD